MESKERQSWGQGTWLGVVRDGDGDRGMGIGKGRGSQNPGMVLVLFFLVLDPLVPAPCPGQGCHPLDQCLETGTGTPPGPPPGLGIGLGSGRIFLLDFPAPGWLSLHSPELLGVVFGGPITPKGDPGGAGVAAAPSPPSSSRVGTPLAPPWHHHWQGGDTAVTRIWHSKCPTHSLEDGRNWNPTFQLPHTFSGGQKELESDIPTASDIPWRKEGVGIQHSCCPTHSLGEGRSWNLTFQLLQVFLGGQKESWNLAFQLLHTFSGGQKERESDIPSTPHIP